MTPADALRAAKALIADPANWITGFYAATSDERAIGWDCANACKFCAVGALARVENKSPKQVEQADELDAGYFLNKAAGETNDYHPHRVNDARGHAAVMAMYDRAIELADASEMAPADRGGER